MSSPQPRPAAGRVGGAMLLRQRPSFTVGLLVSTGAVVLSTLAVYALREEAPVVSLGVVYLFAVLLVSTFWGLSLGIATSLASALAFNFFHIPPTGRLTIADSRDWVALVTFLAVALAVSTIAELARSRAQEAEARREEADLAADLARLLLGGELRSALRVVAQRVAGAVGSSSASVVLETDPAVPEGQAALPLRYGDQAIGTLMLPATLDETALERVRERIVPPLEATLAAAVERERLMGEVVETAALRRSDVIKTTLLRAVSHDLRSPLTAIATGTEALASPSLAEGERDQLAAAVTAEVARLTDLIDKLLDLSRLQSGAARPRPDWCSIDELIRAAVLEQPAGPEAFQLSIDPELPLVRIDAAQLERALANLLQNAARHASGKPVTVRARQMGQMIKIRVADNGPGIAPRELERVFEPFYRSPSHPDGSTGPGLGLAIVRGFVEANGGRVWAESLPGQGATFVIELPVEES